MYRHHPQTTAVADLVAGGELGEVRYIRTIFGFNGVRLFGGTNIRFSPELGGGALMDVGSYCVSGARLVAGEPLRVQGTQALGPTGVDLDFAGTLEFADGVLAQFQCGFTIERRYELEVIGTDGRLRVATPYRIEEPGVDLWTANGHRRIEIQNVDSYRLQLDNFSAAIEGDALPLLGRSDALGQARALAALRASATSGETVALRDS